MVFLNFFETSRFRLNIDELSSQVLQNRWNPRWISRNTGAIETKFHGKNYCSTCRFRRKWLVFHGFAWNKFLFKFQNPSLETQTFLERAPQFCMETKNFLAVFGHIFVVIRTTTLSIERRMRGRNFYSNSRIRR